MPLDPDFLTQIVNVNWGGVPVFVFGGFNEEGIFPAVGQGNIYCVTFESDNSSPKIHTILMPRGLNPMGSSYHLVDKGKDGTEPTFLMCGNELAYIDTVDGAGNPVKFSRLFSMIYISNDGLDWRKVHEQAGTGDPFHGDSQNANPMGLVWNSESFYYDQYFNGADQIFKSSDGKSWSMISSTAIDDPSSYRSDFSDTYCVDNDCLDERGQHVPDGVMDSDGDKVTMQPEQPPIAFYGNGYHSFNISSEGETYGSSRVKIKIIETDEGGHETTKESTVSIPGIAKVMCVGGVNDIWMAGGFKGLDSDGGGAVAMSTDRGTTWTSVINTPQPILTLSAGQIGTV